LGPSHTPISHPRSAHEPTDIKVLIMLNRGIGRACAWLGWFAGRRGGFGQLRRETVSGAAYCFYVGFVPGGFQRFAQAPDMHVYRAFLDKNMVAPHLVEQLGARKHTFGMRHEKV